MNPTSKPKQKADYRLEMLDDEILLFHPNEAKILYCNQTASLIWQLCHGRYTVAEMITLLRTAFPESKETITTDVNTTLQQFLAHGAIELI